MTATVAGRFAAFAPRADRKAYVVWIALIWLGLFAGFGLDFGRFVAAGPPPFMHLHIVVFTSWMVLVTVQVLLVEGGAIRLHKRLGWATAVLSAAMVPIGFTAAMVGEARIAGTPEANPHFLSLEFEELLAFAAFMVAGLLMRKDAAAHKRLMILSALGMADVGFGRLWVIAVKWTLPGPVGWWLQYWWATVLILGAMMAWDLLRWRRVNPVLIGGAAFLLCIETTATVLYHSPAWKQLMTGFVAAWPYMG